MDRADVNECVPSLHCNQSSFEGFFSVIRHMEKDYTDQYASGVQQQNSFNHLSSKKMGIPHILKK